MNSWQVEFGSTFAGRPVLVTGATGFIGWHLCQALSELGARVYAFARTARLVTVPHGCHSVSADVMDLAAVRAFIMETKPGLIYHLAGKVTARQDLDLVLPMLQDNVVGTVHMLTAATEVGCDRFVIAGSSEEPNGDTGEDVPNSPYSAAKATVSLFARMFYRLYHLPVVLVKPFMTYGPRQESSKLIPYTITTLLRGEPPRLSSGTRICDLVYVLDVVRGLLLAGTRTFVEGKTIELGTGQGIPVRQAVMLVRELLDSNVPLVFGSMPDRVSETTRVADLAAAKQLLNWTPTWNLSDGLGATIAWYRDSGRGVHETV